MYNTILLCKTGQFLTCKTGPIFLDKYINIVANACLNFSMVTSDVDLNVDLNEP